MSSLLPSLPPFLPPSSLPDDADGGSLEFLDAKLLPYLLSLLSLQPRHVLRKVVHGLREGGREGGKGVWVGSVFDLLLFFIRREGGREGGREEGRVGGGEGVREGLDLRETRTVTRRKGGRKGGREGGREGGDVRGCYIQQGRRRKDRGRW